MPLPALETYAHDAVLKDGRTVRVRPIRPEDTQRMLAMWQRLSAESIRLRFFAPRPMDVEQMRYFTELDYEHRFGLVAETGGRIVGVARFDRLAEEPETAEFAILVEDAEQGRGIGTALLRALVEPAEKLGISGFVGEVLRENSKMLHMLRDAGLEPAFADYGEVVHTRFRPTPTETFLATGDEQDRRAAVAALSTLFRPSSIAVVGASRDPQTMGGLVFDNLLRGRFQGPVYPVNPAASSVQSVAAYATLADCPTVPELALVCVPAPAVVDVVHDAARLGTAVAVILSAGFAEAGDEGAARERELMDVVRGHGIRILGPNCMGVVNAGTDVRMNGTFSQIFPPAGRVAFSSQSGALGLAILDAASRLNLGLSTFASVGNTADLSGNDLLQYWESDPDTDVILLYFESFGEPRKFGRIARRISCRKPIVVVKSARTTAGERAAATELRAHQPAAGDAAVEALFRQAGVIRTDTLEDLFGVAMVLANQPVPAGNRVAILTSGIGPGILAADACESNGLTVPELAPHTRAGLAAFLPGRSPATNPVDLTPSPDARNYGRAIRVLADDPNVDALLVIVIPPAITEPDRVAREMAAARARLDGCARAVPIVSVFMSELGVPAQLTEAGIPSFRFPEGAAQALGHAARYGQWRGRDHGHVVEVEDADVATARAVVSEALAGGTPAAWLDVSQADRLLRSFGVSTARSHVVHTGDEAAQAQAEIGGPVAVKAAAPVVKSELGGVRLGLATPDTAGEAVGRIRADLTAGGHDEVAARGFLVQEMITDGVEVVVGVTHDRVFGPILMAGVGGALSELLADVGVRLHPLTDVDVEEMLTSLRGYPLLTGYRGSQPVDVQALKALLFRLSALVEEVPEIDELDLNPVFVRRRGVAVVDARIRVARDHHRPRR